MKKKLLVLLLLMIPFFVNATDTGVSCDYALFVEYQKASNNITYETSYSMKDKTFTIKFYNVISGIYLDVGSTVKSGNEEGVAVVENIAEGTNLKVSVDTSKTNCAVGLRTLNITLPYYNEFYGSVACEEYKTKLTICSSKFLSYKSTEELLENMIENYNNSIGPDETVAPPKTRTFLDDIKDFTIKWGIQILLVAISSGVTIVLFNGKLRKIKHGI